MLSSWILGVYNLPIVVLVRHIFCRESIIILCTGTRAMHEVNILCYPSRSRRHDIFRLQINPCNAILCPIQVFLLFTCTHTIIIVRAVSPSRDGFSTCKCQNLVDELMIWPISPRYVALLTRVLSIAYVSDKMSGI